MGVYFSLCDASYLPSLGREWESSHRTVENTKEEYMWGRRT